MSWTEKIKEGIVITTGDGQVYTPLYMITSKDITYNIAEFEFPEIEGTLVKRSKPKGARYNIELIFQGENHLDVARNFENSNKDPRAWTVSHPLYGNLTVQPTSLSFDPSGLNTTRITGEVVETITDDYPRTSIDLKSKIFRDLEVYRSTVIDSYTSSVDIKAEGINTLKNQTESIYKKGNDAIKTSEQSNQYYSLFSEAIGNITFGIANTSKMITSVYDLITYPYLFADSVKNRIDILKRQFDSLNQSISTTNTRAEKINYETIGGALISAQILSSINSSDGDYENSNDVFGIINSLLNSYNSYISNLDFFQSANGSDVNGYIPTYSTVNSISNAIDYATSNLFDIALNAKKERSYILDKDTAIIILAHRFYGLDENDDNLIKFINQNNFSFNELLILKKGRKVLYYI